MEKLSLNNLSRNVLSQGGAEVFLASTLVGHVNDQIIRLDGKPLQFHKEVGAVLSGAGDPPAGQLGAQDSSTSLVSTDGEEKQDQEDSQDGGEK